MIGSAPTGQRAAIQVTKLNKRVTIAERKTVVRGVCINVETKSFTELFPYGIYTIPKISTAVQRRRIDRARHSLESVS